MNWYRLESFGTTKVQSLDSAAVVEQVRSVGVNKKLLHVLPDTIQSTGFLCLVAQFLKLPRK